MKSLSSLANEGIRLVLPLIILGGGVVAFAAIISHREPPKRAVVEELPPLVGTAPVTLHQDRLNFDVDGVVVPFREISLAAEVSGRIAYKATECRAGRYVTAGTVLFRIDPRNYELEVDRARNELEQARVSLEEADVEIANTRSLVALAEQERNLQKRQLERTFSLRDRGVSTAQQVEDAQRTELTSRNSLQTLKNQLRMLETSRRRLEQSQKLAQVKLDEAELNRSRAEVTAPLDGVIVSEAVEQDSYVQPGTALVTIEDTSAAEVRCNLRMEELQWLLQQPRPTHGAEGEVAALDAAEPLRVLPHQDYHLPPTPVTVSYEVAGRRYQWNGVLTRYEGIGLDERTRTVPCRVLVEQPRSVLVDGSTGQPQNGPRALVRGMFVGVTVHASPDAELLQVSESAIRPGNFVWRVRDSRLQVLPVRIARIREDVALLEADRTELRADDRVVVTPLSAVSEGMEVREESTP